MSDNFQRLGRSKHPVLGPGVEVIYRLWDGWRQREVWEKSWFPTNQAGITLHPRSPTGYSVESLKLEQPVRNACVSRSVSFYEELCRYASFRWG